MKDLLITFGEWYDSQEDDTIDAYVFTIAGEEEDYIYDRTDYEISKAGYDLIYSDEPILLGRLNDLQIEEVTHQIVCKGPWDLNDNEIIDIAHQALAQLYSK